MPHMGALSHAPSFSTPSSSRCNADRFIPQRSAMDLEVSHMELTRAADAENSVNASPAKEECARHRCTAALLHACARRLVA